jgi:hypothetical protein
MIDNCFNSVCNRELHYLRDGRVIRIVRGYGGGATFVHYWLCGPCYTSYDFSLSADGSVTLCLRPVRSDGTELQLNLAEVRGPERRSSARISSTTNDQTTQLEDINCRLARAGRLLRSKLAAAF